MNNDKITNVTCSILKHYNIDYKHSTIKILDDELSKNYRNVVLVLLDGLGLDILNTYLPEDSFLRKNFFKTITSVIPSTTNAALTSILTGLSPKEHGWIGWDVYVKPVNEVVTLWDNVIKDTKITFDYNVADKYFKNETIIEKINKVNDINAYYINPYNGSYSNFDEMVTKIKESTLNNGKNFIFAYSEEPDGIFHKTGVGSSESIKVVQDLNGKMEELSNILEDTLLIITADHGHINAEGITLSEITSIFNLLETDISLDGRFTSFNVLKENHELFIKTFNELFKSDFDLYPKEEIINSNMFDGDKEHPLFKDALGDFISIAKTNKFFRYSESSVNYKSMHSALTKEEMNVPLIIKEIK